MIIIPLGTSRPRVRTPWATYSLMVLCIWVMAYEISVPESLQGARFIPASPDIFAWISSLFLHGGVLHLIGNMLYLWIFGNNIEEAMGHVRYLLFYLLAGIAAALTMAFMDPLSTHPMVGASGAISGVLGAYMLVYPRARVTVLVPLLIILYPFRINAVWVVGVWFAMQLLALTGPDTSGIAWWAHVGGFAAGIALTPFLKGSGVPFFGPRPTRGPWG